MTGGTGVLGRLLVPRLLQRGHAVRVLSRRSDATVVAPARVVTGDLRSGAGLDDAVRGVDVVVHAATSPFRQTRRTDVDGSQRLIDALRGGDVHNVIYVSIVGVDRHPMAYYRAKHAAEQVLEKSGLPTTILRATQFHDLVDGMLSRVGWLPVLPVPRGFVFQPVDSGEVADELARLVDAGPLGRVPDMGGPAVRGIKDLTRAWLRARGRRRPVLGMPVPGRIGRAFRAGVHTCPDRAVGEITWEQYLERR